MHELFITESIFSSAGASLPNGVLTSAVTHLYLRLGRLDAVIEETLQFLFRALRAEKGFPNAELHIELEEVACRCDSCDAVFTIDLPLFRCPQCESGHVQVIRGRGIVLTRIVADVPKEAYEHPGNP